jgi:asparagine synthetase B (glutamine-hydrolysing)
MEVDRLWKRNLGRDDRCLSDHGKECRFPYLDEDVMAYLSELPVEMKCDMMRPLGEGDKLILRIIARTLGMHSCSTLVKRAIQFGSRIAKVSDVKRFGSGRQAKGQTKIIADKSRELCEDVNHATVNDKQ